MILELTKEQAELLSETLMCHTDEGPPGEGWKSQELEALWRVIDGQIERQEKEQKCWQLVPCRPSLEMYDAAYDLCDASSGFPGIKELWKTMLAAVPLSSP